MTDVILWDVLWRLSEGHAARLMASAVSAKVGTDSGSQMVQQYLHAISHTSLSVADDGMNH